MGRKGSPEVFRGFDNGKAITPAEIMLEKEIKARIGLAFLPEQYAALVSGSRINFSPEMSLVEALLEDAVRSLKRGAPTKRSGRRWREWREAKEWIFGEQDQDWPFSFLNVCEFLGFDPQAVRRELCQQTDVRAAVDSIH